MVPMKKINFYTASISMLVCFLMGGGSAIGQTVKSDATPPPAAEVELSIIDTHGKVVSDIGKDELELLINGKEHAIQSIELVTSPTIYALAVDNSGSMRMLLPHLITAANTLVDANSGKDTTALVRFVSRDKITSTSSFLGDSGYLKAQINNLFIEGGHTALVDAIVKSVLFVAEQKDADAELRRTVVVFSDGEERDSLYKEDQLMRVLAEAKVRVFFLGIVFDFAKREQKIYTEFIDRVARKSGGAAIFPKKADQINDAAKELAKLIRTRYVVKYDSGAAANSKVEIKLAKTSKRKDLSLYY